MRRSWRDYWPFGTKERESFEDVDKLIQDLQTQVTALTTTVNDLETRVEALENP